MKKRLLFLICFFALCSFDSPALTIEQPPKRTNETMIFFPDKEIESILAIEKEGIFVPYKEYKALYDKAKTNYFKIRNKAVPPIEIEKPSIIQANYSGTVEGDILILSANYKIVQNSEKSQILNFPLENVLYLNAKLNNKKALFYKKKWHA